MVSLTEKSSTENQTNGSKIGSFVQIFFAGFSFFLLAILIIIIMKYRSKSYKNNKKNSCYDIDNTGLSINSGTLSQNITRMKISNSFASNTDSDSSEDVLYENNPKFGAKNYVVDRVQPKRSAFRQQSISSIESDIESVPSIVVSVVNDGNQTRLSLIKAKNLRRSGNSSNDKMIPEGVFARIFPSDTFSQESQVKKSDEFFETNLVKSKKSKIIKFNENEKFAIDNQQFPIRISLYECDKQKMRFSIGHSILNLNTRENYHSNQIIELDLFQTIYKAQNVNQVFK